MLGANWAIPGAELNFKVMDTQWGNIACGRSRSRIAGMSREGYPELPLGKRGRWAEAFSVQEALHRAWLRVYPANPHLDRKLGCIRRDASPSAPTEPSAAAAIRASITRRVSV